MVRCECSVCLRQGKRREVANQVKLSYMQTARSSRPLLRYHGRGNFRCPMRFVHASSQPPTGRPVDDGRSPALDPTPFYTGPLAQTFRNLKLFSLSSLGLIAGLSPVLFVVEAPGIPVTARVALAGTALAMSGASTGLIAWCGAPYVSSMRRLVPSPPPASDPTAGTVKPEGASSGSSVTSTMATHYDAVEMATKTLFSRDIYTQIYDPAVLGSTNRPFATWELQSQLRVPVDASNTSRIAGGREEVIARTLSAGGEVYGEWLVRWTQDPNNEEYLLGRASATGTVLR